MFGIRQERAAKVRAPDRGNISKAHGSLPSSAKGARLRDVATDPDLSFAYSLLPFKINKARLKFN